MGVILRFARLNSRASSHRGAPLSTRAISFYTCFSVGKSLNPVISCQKLARIHGQKAAHHAHTHTKIHRDYWRGGLERDVLFTEGLATNIHKYIRIRYNNHIVVGEFSMKPENWQFRVCACSAMV